MSWASSNYFVVVSLQPMLLGSLTDYGHFTLSAASLALSANMLGALIGNVLTFLLLARVSAKTLIILGALAMTAFQLCAARLPLTPGNFTLLMLGTGWGTGVLGSASWATVAVMERPTRVFAIMGAALVITGAAAIYVAPHVVARFGLSGLLVGLAVAAAIVLPTVPFFFEPGVVGLRATEGDKAPTALGRGTALLILSLALVYVANNATWAYLELIAKAAGLVGDQVGSAIAVGQLSAVAGSMWAARFEGVQARPAILVALLFILVSTAALIAVHNTVAMTLIVAAFMGALSFAVPLYLADLVNCDASGRLVVWGQVAIGVGLMVGPPAASIVVESSSLKTMIWTASVVYLLSLALAALSFRLRPLPGTALINSPVE